jgi:hypothetical protein
MYTRQDVELNPRPQPRVASGTTALAASSHIQDEDMRGYIYE